MAKVTIKKEIILTLTEEEANWLESMTQNYFGNPSTESPKEYEIRSALFHAVNTDGNTLFEESP